MPNVNDSDPCEPPPPYSMVAGLNVDAQGKNEAYRSPEYQSQDIHAQMGDYTAPPGYPPHTAFPPPPSFSPQHPGPYSAPSQPTGYNTAYIQQPGAYVAGPQQTTVIVQQPLLAPAVRPFREMPVRAVCPKCQASVVTVTYYENGTLTWLLCVILCLIGCDAGCCLIPFCADSCKDVVHVCPNCHQYISTFHRL